MSYISKQLYHQDIWKNMIRQDKIEQDRIVGVGHINVKGNK